VNDDEGPAAPAPDDPPREFRFPFFRGRDGWVDGI